MHPSFEEMTVAERILHVQELWDRIAAAAEQEPLTPGQAEALDHRLADYRSNPGTSVPWAEARERMRTR